MLTLFFFLFHPFTYAFWDAGNRRDAVLACAEETTE